MNDPKAQLPHEQTEHEQLQALVGDVGRWFETDTGQAFKQITEEREMPKFVLHLLMDTTRFDPSQVPQTMTTAFMLGAKFMREWMEKRQAEPLPEIITKEDASDKPEGAEDL